MLTKQELSMLQEEAALIFMECRLRYWNFLVISGTINGERSVGSECHSRLKLK